MIYSGSDLAAACFAASDRVISGFAAGVVIIFMSHSSVIVAAPLSLETAHSVRFPPTADLRDLRRFR
jgi:hypothetical protein